PDKVNQMLNLYAAGNHEQMLENVLTMINHSVRSHASAASIKQLCVDILNTWLRAIAANNKHDFSIEQNSLLFEHLNACVTEEDIVLFFRETSKELFRDSEHVNPQKDVFADVIHYIDHHYSSDLS